MNPVGRAKALLQKAFEFSDHTPVMQMITDDELEKVESSLWATSPERAWYMNRREKVFLFACMGGLLLIIAVWLGQPPRTEGESWWGVFVLGVAASILCYCTFPYWAARRAFLERRRRSAAHLAARALSSLGEEKPVPLNKLLVYNRRQLDAYQDESHRQQRRANLHAQLASAIGLLILVAGISLSLRQEPGTEQYVVAGLSGLGTLLSAFIGATFLRNARRADEQLSLYYQEPHITGRVILAELVAESLCSATKADEGKAIVSQLLTWPVPKLVAEDQTTP